MTKWSSSSVIYYAPLSLDNILKMSTKISAEERSLISAAYKNFAGNKRAELRVINAIERKEQEKENNEQAEYASTYRNSIEKELKTLCLHVISVIDTQLLTKAVDLEDKVFYHKMKGDYYRYLCEFVVGSEFSEHSHKGRQAYLEAENLCQMELQPTNPVRLGLYLNMAVFYYEIYSLVDEKYRHQALSIADQAFEDALQSIDSVNEVLLSDSKDPPSKTTKTAP